MTMRRAGLIVAAALFGALASGCSNDTGAPASDVSADDLQRLQALEVREAIRQLLIDYGRTIDSRDFGGFADLFTADADYGGGGPGGMSHGPEAIRAGLEKNFQQNPSGVSGPNFHVFYNESIQVDGDTATAVSKGAFVIQAEGNRPEMLILATYHDSLVRDGGRWKFKRRELQPDIPAPR